MFFVLVLPLPLPRPLPSPTTEHMECCECAGLQVALSCLPTLPRLSPAQPSPVHETQPSCHRRPFNGISHHTLARGREAAQDSRIDMQPDCLIEHVPVQPVKIGGEQHKQSSATHLGLIGFQQPARTRTGAGIIRTGSGSGTGLASDNEW
ncbi:hypothetical protein CPLU01_06949 [Colletotrichum plurivorum]|uniref:Uncharacterized protein n=1 Tax=Colletotrichum plurivorum TaxID=2175906 RepID=A0A8H6KHE9_9PEZI|nr:hypothetical protein CPLU01_06949 [Colletotrichum plurivorum]